MARCTVEEAQRTRERLLDAALDVFHSEGVAKPSLTKVAARAGLSRGAIYGHFTNKADLFSALCDQVTLPAEVLADMRSVCPDQPLEALRQWFITLMSETVSNPRRRKMLEIIYHRCEISEESGGILRRMLVARDAANEHITQLISRAVHLGQLPADLHIASAVSLFHASVIGIFSYWLLLPDDSPFNTDPAPFADALIAMLHTPTLRHLPTPTS